MYVSDIMTPRCRDQIWIRGRRSDMRAIVLLMSGLVVVSACGGSDAPPAAPTPTVTQLTLSQTVDVLFIKEVRVFAATATYSDGSTRVASAGWSSDAPAVATVTGAGQVQALASGEATIIVDVEGRRATHRVRVLPEYAGRWEGGWREVGCEATGDWRGLCDDSDITAVWFIGVDLAQDRDVVTGRIMPYTDLPFATTGSVAIDGALSQQGSATFDEDGFTFTLELFDWVSRSTTNQTMTGAFKVRYSSPDFEGRLLLTMELVHASKIGIVPSTVGRSHAVERPSLRLPAARRP
jgi:hypothetical protein